MEFQISGLDADAFAPLFDLPDDELARRGTVRKVVDHSPGYPCRVSLADAEVGEEILLLPYLHHDTDSPYRGSGPVFVRHGVPTQHLGLNEIPRMLNHRLLSFRAYDEAGMMLGAATESGDGARAVIESLFASGEAAYLHIHNAGPGCFNCEVRRVG